MTDAQAAEILEELRGIRAAVEALAPADVAAGGPCLRRRDRDALARILPVLAGVFGGEPFATWEALDVAQNDKGSAGENLRLVLGKRSANELGRLLQRGSGHSVADIEIMRDGRAFDGVRWRCHVMSSSFAT